MTRLHLIPVPRSVKMTGGRCELLSETRIVLGSHPAAREELGAERFADEVERLTGWRVGIHEEEGTIRPRIAMRGSGGSCVEIRTRFDVTAGNGHEQGYRLTISRDGIEIAAGAATGMFYGFQTLTQIVRQMAFAANQRSKLKNQESLQLPCVVIEDWPDFARRGVYHDCARGKIPKVETLLQLIDDLGHLKYNELQLYIENGFEFRRHPEMYDDTTPLTAEDLRQLDAACRAWHIDFVPSLTSLGHFEKILSRPAFAHLAEAQPEELRAMGADVWVDAPWSLCVTDPEAKGLLKDMYDEFLPNFSSGQFNICCDEAYDLGKVRSKELAEKIGTGQLYVDWIRYCADLARSHGKSIQMWGDIILHHPELIGQLPEDAVLLEWGYEADHKFDEHCAIFAERLRTAAKGEGGGRQQFYVCPGTSSWLTLPSRTKNTFGNIHNAAQAGLKHGATGILVTDWGDNGHQQLLAVSLTAFAYGAAEGWGGSKKQVASSKKTELLKAISLHLFKDPEGALAGLAYDLGLTYERFRWRRFNAGLEWYLFREKWDFANYVNRARAQELPRVIGACERLKQSFGRAKLSHPDAALLREEFILTCDEVIHACHRTALRKKWLAARGNTKRTPRKRFKQQMVALAAELRAIEKQFARLWLARNKRSRLEDVLAEFRRMREEYRRFGRASMQ